MKHIAIFGPTAVGKSSLSIKLAKHFRTEVISADSVQVYKRMNIGSAKLRISEMQGITHHMIDVLEPGADFSVADFSAFSIKVISKLEMRNRPAIVVGGTGLYIKALTDGLADLPFDKNIRNELLKQDPQKLHDELRNVDPAYASVVAPNNVRKVIRALEVYKLTGKIFSMLYKETEAKFQFHKFGLIKNKEQLYKDIDDRVDNMMDRGLFSEVLKIHNRYKKEIDKIDAIGYKELISHIKGEIGFEAAVDLIKQNSRRYAKRQITWLKSNNFVVIDVDNEDPYEYILNHIKNEN